MADNLQPKVPIIQLDLDTSKFSEGISDANKALGDLNNTPVDKPFKNLKAQLKEATVEAQKMASQFGKNSAQFTQAAQRVANLRDEFQEFNASVEAFNPDNKLQGLASLAKGAVGAVQGVAGAMAFLGVESDTAAQTMAKLQGLMAFSDALSSVDDIKVAYQNFGAVIKSTSAYQAINNGLTAAAATVQKLFTGSVDTTSVSFKGLKGAIAATGIGLLVIGVVALIQNFDKLKVALGFASKEQEAFGKASKEANEAASTSAGDAIKNVSEVKNAFEQARKGVISKEEALKKYNDTLGDSFGKTNDLTKAEKLLADKAPAYIEMMALKAKATVFFNKAAEEAAKGLNASQEDQTSWFDKAKASLQSYVGDYSGSVSTLVDAQKKGQKEVQESAANMEKMFTDEAGKLIQRQNELGKKAGVKTPDQIALEQQQQKDRDAAAAKAKAEREKRQKELEDERNKFKSHLEELEKIREAAVKSTVDNTLSERQQEIQGIEQHYQEVRASTQKIYDDELKSLTAAKKKGLLSNKEYNDKILQLNASSEKANEAADAERLSKRLETEQKYNKIVADFVDGFQTSEYQRQRQNLIKDFDEKIAIADDKQKALLEKLKAGELEKLDKTETLRKNTVNTETTLVDVKTKNQVDENDTPEQRLEKLQAVYDAEKAFKEAQFQEELAKLGEDQDAIRNLKAKHQAEVTEDERGFSASRKEIAKQEAEQKAANMKAVGDATNTLADIVGKQTVAGKALGVATALINTYQGASEVIKAKSVLPEPFGTIQKVASVAGIIATGMRQVKAITAVQIPGGKGGGVSAPPVPQTAPIINATQTAAAAGANQVQDVRLTNPVAVRAVLSDRELRDNQQRNNYYNNLQVG